MQISAFTALFPLFKPIRFIQDEMLTTFFSPRDDKQKSGSLLSFPQTMFTFQMCPMLRNEKVKFLIMILNRQIIS